MAREDSVLSIRHLTVVKQHKQLVDDLSCSLQRGEILSIIGPNGAGKTTLIKAILQDCMDYCGQIYFAGQSMSQWPPKYRAKCIAALPQFNDLRFPFTVEQVVALGRLPHSSGAKVNEQVMSDVLARLDLCHLRHRLYTQLSGGEKQRTQLARVFAQIWSEKEAQGPRLLVLDEPTNALDIGHKQKLMADIRQMAEEGVTVLWVEHDLALVSRYSDRCLVMEKGAAVALGDTSTTLDSQLVNRVFQANVDMVEDRKTGRRIIAL